MVVGHIVLLITAQSADSILVESLLSSFSHFRGLGEMGVIVWADLARLVMLCLVVETNSARLGLVTGSDRRLAVAVWAASRVFSTQHFLAKIAQLNDIDLYTVVNFKLQTRAGYIHWVSEQNNANNSAIKSQYQSGSKLTSILH